MIDRARLAIALAVKDSKLYFKSLVFLMCNTICCRHITRESVTR